MVNEDQTPMRFIGWAVARTDGSSSFGTFNRRETAEEVCTRIRAGGEDVHVVRAEVPDELAQWKQRALEAEDKIDGQAWEDLQNQLATTQADLEAMRTALVATGQTCRQLRAALTELTAASLDARIIDTVRCNRWHAAVNKSEQILKGETE